MIYLTVILGTLLGQTTSYFFLVDSFSIFYFSVTAFFFNTSSILFTYVFVFKLVASWFFIVWLRMNLLRFRFDQVASYTWHEMVIYTVFLLIEVILGVWVL